MQIAMNLEPSARDLSLLERLSQLLKLLEARFALQILGKNDDLEKNNEREILVARTEGGRFDRKIILHYRISAKARLNTYIVRLQEDVARHGLHAQGAVFGAARMATEDGKGVEL